MQNFLDSFSALFTFLFQQLTNMANFFTTSIIGQIIIGLVVFAVIVNLLIKFIGSFKK